MARYAMVTDLRKCVGCQACTVACNAEWDVPAGHARTHVRPTPLAGTFPDLTSSVYVAQCNHCDHPPCVEPCPIRRDVPGRRTASCRWTRRSASAAASAWRPARTTPASSTRSTKKVDKCDFCASRLERGAAAGLRGDLHRAREVLRRPRRPRQRRLPDGLPGRRRPHRDADRRRRAERLLPGQARAPRPGPLDVPAARARGCSRPARRGSELVKPLVLAAVGATFVGQAVAFFTQLRKGEKDFED